MKKKGRQAERPRSAAPGAGASSKNLFVTGYEKLTVSQDFELRKTVRGAGGKYQVVKNNMAREGVAKARRPRRC